MFGQLYLYTGEPPADERDWLICCSAGKGLPFTVSSLIPLAQRADYHSCGVASVCHYVVGGALPVARCNVEHITTLQRLPEAE